MPNPNPHQVSAAYIPHITFRIPHITNTPKTVTIWHYQFVFTLVRSPKWTYNYRGCYFPVWFRRTFSAIIRYLPSGPTRGRFELCLW